MKFVSMAFVATATIAPLSIVFGYRAIVDTLSYGFTLFEESLAFMGSAKDQWKMTYKGVLVRHSKDLLPPQHDSAELLQRCEDIVFSLGSTKPLIRDTPSAFVRTSHFMASARG